MSEASEIERLADAEYKYGFVTDVEEDQVPKGLSEDVVRTISSIKKEPAWLLDFRLKALESASKLCPLTGVTPIGKYSYVKPFSVVPRILPPVFSFISSTRGLKPFLANSAAQASPPMPPPMTIISCLLSINAPPY